MRRPGIGCRVLRGLGIIVNRTENQIASGFIPPDWTGEKLRDVKLACRYARKLVIWQANRRLERKEEGEET